MRARVISRHNRFGKQGDAGGAPGAPKPETPDALPQAPIARQAPEPPPMNPHTAQRIRSARCRCVSTMNPLPPASMLALVEMANGMCRCRVLPGYIDGSGVQPI